MAAQSGSTGQEAHVTFTRVQKTYDGETLIVRDLNLEIRRGEFLTLLGPSGSGKTTCLMMLAGFETPTSGEIRVGGTVINKVPPHRRNIGMVFQNYALFPHMTVAENLRFPLSVRKLPAADIDAKVKRALAMVRLEAFGNRYPQQLSGGQQQRIALARALVFEPELVLMDEPLGALDKQLREHMQIEIKHLHDSLGITFVFVTHDQGEALTMSDRIAVFDRGEIQQIDSAECLYEEPANAFVAGFIGESNTFQGTLLERNGDACAIRLPSGAVVQARAADVGAVGSSAVVSVRPERIVLNGASAGCENRFSAKVKELIYQGDHVRVQLDLGNQSSLMVKAPISQLSHELRPEQPIEVGIPATHLRALAPTPSA
ncbi:MAG: ABC transporter ATP-binding protein [Proteobacteria bacterium]|nr:ABC transporter ATP-binding protein [Pseudomonadota bacterium]